MKGSIKVDSVFKKGTTYYISLCVLVNLNEKKSDKNLNPFKRQLSFHPLQAPIESFENTRETLSKTMKDNKNVDEDEMQFESSNVNVSCLTYPSEITHSGKRTREAQSESKLTRKLAKLNFQQPINSLNTSRDLFKESKLARTTSVMSEIHLINKQEQ